MDAETTAAALHAQYGTRVRYFSHGSTAGSRGAVRTEGARRGTGILTLVWYGVGHVADVTLDDGSVLHLYPELGDQLEVLPERATVEAARAFVHELIEADEAERASVTMAWTVVVTDRETYSTEAHGLWATEEEADAAADAFQTSLNEGLPPDDGWSCLAVRIMEHDGTWGQASHYVTLEDSGWRMEHPLACRLSGELRRGCPFEAAVAEALIGKPDGRYRFVSAPEGVSSPLLEPADG